MSTLKTVTLPTAIAVFAFAATQTPGFAGEPDAAAASCGACHQGKRSLGGRDGEQLAAKIRAILDGKAKHPPLGLEDTSDEAVAELAEALAAGE